MPYNLVHTYITGDHFDNIFGGQSPSMFGQITHVKHMTPMMEQRWPWMRNMWEVSDNRHSLGHFKTLKEAKEFAKSKWPSCGFKTPKEFQKE